VTLDNNTLLAREVASPKATISGEFTEQGFVMVTYTEQIDRLA
jgi:hypothetical protein